MVTVLSLGWCLETFAQKDKIPIGAEQSKELFFRDRNRDYMELPYKMINNLLIIKVSINDSDTLNFILDTGLNTSIISELPPDEEFSFKTSREIELQGYGQGETLKAIHTFGNRIEIGDIVGVNQDFFILSKNDLMLSQRLGYRVHGILAFNIFREFMVGIDYDSEELIFYDPYYFDYDKHARRFHSVPLLLSNYKPYTNIQVSRPNGKPVKVKLLIDTGASHALWLDPESIPGAIIPEKTISSLLGTGLSGNVYGKLGRLPEARIGPYRLKDPIVSFPDSLSRESSAGLDDRNGALGGEFLKRFDLIIDYPNHRISIRRNSNFRNDFSYNMTGIEIIAPYPGLPVFFISEIRENSPADQAGLQTGDQLLRLNRTDISRYTMNEIYQIFQRKHGKRIRITVLREGEKIKAKIVLKEYI